MADKLLTYAALAAGAYFLLGRGAAVAPAAGGNGRSPLLAPFPEFAPIEPTDSGSYVAPDVYPSINGICCMAMSEACLECARRNWGSSIGGYVGGLFPRPEVPITDPYTTPSLSDQLRSYPDYALRHPTPVVY